MDPILNKKSIKQLYKLTFIQFSLKILHLIDSVLYFVENGKSLVFIWLCIWLLTIIDNDFVYTI